MARRSAGKGAGKGPGPGNGPSWLEIVRTITTLIGTLAALWKD